MLHSGLNVFASECISLVVVHNSLCQKKENNILTLCTFHILSIFCSGVATLSGTDSSATSSEDASNPGSPYSPSSSDDLQHPHVNDTNRLKQQQQVPNTKQVKYTYIYISVAYRFYFKISLNRIFTNSVYSFYFFSKKITATTDSNSNSCTFASSLAMECTTELSTTDCKCKCFGS